MQQYNVYAIGQTTQIEAYQTDDEGEPESPMSPQILLRPPTGPEVELAVTESPVGHIYHRLRVTVAGRYYWRVVTIDDALDGFFEVKPSAFTTPLPP